MSTRRTTRDTTLLITVSANPFFVLCFVILICILYSCIEFGFRMYEGMSDSNKLDSIVEAMPARLIDLDSGRLVTKEDTKEQYKRNGGSESMSEFFRYAILSHRWGSREPTFDELQDKGLNNLEDRPGVSKLRSFRSLAKERKCRWGWSDTVCIDKRSSAELQEAINSMFSWYRESALCIALLEGAYSVHTLHEDVWFTRGWTLQELLAPKCLKFFIRNCEHQSPDECRSHWKQLAPGNNDKDDEALLHKVAEVTGISQTYLGLKDDAKGLGFEPGVENLRERMRWAANRKTTRIEDLAYCLLGIFRISMPIIYGEKEAAFFRLQEEILKRTNDKSLFDWGGRPSAFNSMLAAEPKCFAGVGKSPPAINWNPLKLAAFYFTPMISLCTYDAFMVAPDYWASFVFGEVSNISEVPSTLTSVGLRGKFQLYNVTGVRMKKDRKVNDDFYRYEINANGLWRFEVETKQKLDAAVRWGASDFGMYRVAVLHPWHHLGGFNTFKGGKKRVAILLEKEEAMRPFAFKRRIPTKEPIMVQMTRWKWLVPQIIYVK